MSFLARLRSRAVRTMPEGIARRRPSDAVRVLVALVLLVLLAMHADNPTAVERSVLRVFTSLPDDAHTFVLILYDLMALWAIGLLVVAVLLLRRWRLARDLAVAAAAAWAIGRLGGFLLRNTDLAHAFRVTFDLTNAPRFPLVRVAVAVALVTVASPHLTRPSRRVGQGLVFVLALTAMYLGRAFPTDLLAAIILGWGIAAAVHYAFGTPAGRPTVGQVGRGLEQLGIQVSDLCLGPDQPLGRAIFLAHDKDRPLRITAIGRDEADAQLMSRVWRFLAYKDASANLFPTRRQQVEYEAYVALLARDTGSRVPSVLFAGTTGALALLVERVAPGVNLQDLDSSSVSDALLDDLWHQVDALHDARIGHGKLDGHHVIVDRGKASIVGFAHASTSVGSRQAAADVAQLLAVTSALVGSERAVAAAVRGVGAEAVTDALPILQLQAVSGWTHDALGGRKDANVALEQLRNIGAEATGTKPPELRSLYRVHPRSLIMAVAALLGVGMLLSRVGDPQVFWETVKNANWWFVALAFGLGMCTDVAFGITFLGNVPIRLPIWPSIELQSALSFSNLAIPVAADTAMQVRFLQRNGLDLPSAVATGGILSTVSEIAVTAGLFFVALWLSPDSIEFGRIDTNQIEVIALIVAFVIGVAMTLVFSIRRLRKVVVPPVVRAARSVWGAIKSPGRVALLICGNVIAQMLYACSLLACLHAFGSSVDFWTLLAINLGISTIASLVPIPGGGTAVSAVGLAGMLTAFGVPPAVGAAAVLSHQVAVSYLPAIPGWFATNDLIRKGLL
ncbi:MAG: flippase-like domain-containing protein [Acidimicrobiia bacterium]|nr:flippase-like domain-containing protein [Acidimicrobiia bacterium]